MAGNRAIVGHYFTSGWKDGLLAATGDTWSASQIALELSDTAARPENVAIYERAVIAGIQEADRRSVAEARARRQCLCPDRRIAGPSTIGDRFQIYAIDYQFPDRQPVRRWYFEPKDWPSEESYSGGYSSATDALLVAQACESELELGPDDDRPADRDR